MSRDRTIFDPAPELEGDEFDRAMAEQTPRQIIAAAVASNGSRRPLTTLNDIMRNLDAAGFAIVKRPTGDQVTVALRGFTAHKPVDWTDMDLRNAMAAALAAAQAADERIPDERTKTLVDRLQVLRAKYDDLAEQERGTQSGGMAGDFSSELCAALCEWEGRADRCDAALKNGGE